MLPMKEIKSSNMLKSVINIFIPGHTSNTLEMMSTAI